MSARSNWRRLSDLLLSTCRRHGVVAALQLLTYRLLNRLFLFERLEFVILTRDRVRPAQPYIDTRFSKRAASAEILATLAKDPAWEIGSDKLDNFRAGDQCLLSYVDGQLAGYSWTCARSRTEILPGLTIALPSQYLYSYAGLTLTRYRGLGLQSYRHRVLLEDSRWSNRLGLLSYARHTNFASRAAQHKSGFKPVARIWLIGTTKHFFMLRSAGARQLGIARLKQSALSTQRATS